MEIKRNYEKPIAISDLVLLDQRRCILCARCPVADEISGDPLIEFKSRANVTEINTFPDLPFSSYFSGNTIQLCPVGALLRPSTGSAPGLGTCRWWRARVFTNSHPRLSVQVSQNEILRLVGVDNDATNHGGCPTRSVSASSTSAPRNVCVHWYGDGELVQTTWADALDRVAERIGLIRDEDGGRASR